jgi:EpsI family protein
MSLLKSSFILVALLVALYLGSTLKPTATENEKYKNFELEKIIPLQFLDWKVDDTLPIVLGSPEQDALLDMLYSQQLSRTYVDSQGNRVMLSISYGDMQNKSSQVHFPEVCYPAQGFEIVSESKATISADKDHIIPVKRLEAVLGGRREFVTYWIRIGDKVALSRIKQKLITIEKGLSGQIADGLLFRVSTINLGQDYNVQEQFVIGLLKGLSDGDLGFLVGEKLEN